jgi:benzoyl-CoA reductase/2-hydroxyglutaryl-CoA dehydratase subunit BcrC/BadD/HgdB
MPAAPGFASVEAVRIEAEARAREAAAAGARVVGFVTAAAPVELIEAAGLYPIELSAGDVRETPLADAIMEDLFHPSIRGLFERLLRGEFAWLSAIMLPRASDAAHRLYYYLCELERTGAAVPKPLLFDMTQTPGAASEAYAAVKLARLWHQLRGLGNGQAGESQLRAAIEQSNRRRDVLESLTALRLDGRVSGAEMLAAFAASRMLPRTNFEKAVPQAGAARKGPRVVIAGSLQDDAGLHGLIEAVGGVVVGDFHAGGEPAIGQAIDARGEPMAALLEHYRGTQAGARSFDDPAALIVEFAKRARADGVVFSYLPEEEALPWDYPEQARALESAGVRQVRLSDQARPYDVEARRGEVETFVKSLEAGR